MNRIAILLFVFSVALSVHSQTILQEGDSCFNKGDYACAKAKYTKAFNSASGKDKQIAEIKLTRAKWCAEHITIADQAFTNKNYKTAKENYQSVIESNPKDAYAQSQLNKCNIYLNPSTTTLSVSKSSLSFTASGGSENLLITTNSSSYSIDLLPTWCSVKKYSNYFVITCNQNIGSSTRNDYFTVSVGEKSVRININQTGVSNKEAISSNKEAITLNVSKESIYFDTKGGISESIKVTSNASSYSVSLIPSWCKVQTYNGYFVVTCNSNYNSQNRSDWFYVNAGDKQVRVNVNQSGTYQNNSIINKRKSKPTNLYLGAGVLKPLVFMADGITPSNMAIGYNFTIGFVKTLGIYAKLSSNFSDVKGDYSYSNFPVDYYTLSDNSDVYTFNRFGLVGGLMLQIKPIILYAGAGKGHFYHYKEINAYRYLDDSFFSRVNLTTISYSGLETDAGLIINFNKVGLSFGVSSFSFKYYEMNAGLGIRF